MSHHMPPFVATRAQDRMRPVQAVACRVHPVACGTYNPGLAPAGGRCNAPSAAPAP